MQTISIVIVNWNGLTDTRACLSSVAAMKPEGVRVETIVVDNGSSDRSAEKIRNEFPWVTVIALSENTGFTGGNNAGMKHAVEHGADYVWLVNNDTILHPDAWRLVEAFADKEVGIAGSKIYFAAGHEYHRDRYAVKDRGKVFWYAGGLIDWANMYASHKGVDEVDRGQYDKQEDTPFITGCSMMIRMSVIARIGYLDPKYYLYLEDLDYCLKAKRAGFGLRYFPLSVVWHVNAGSSGGAGKPLHEYYMTRNRLLIGFRYAPLRTKAALLREALRFLFGREPVRRRAVQDALLMRWGGRYDPKNIH